MYRKSLLMAIALIAALLGLIMTAAPAAQSPPESRLPA